ncbi:MAG: nucleoside hydrolase [Maricaulaceae bacterium]|nr:nucleoside hydrolase [Maricaulaceae bacterium]
MDDCIALFAAFASPEFELLGVTTVAGNVPVEVCARNALCAAALAGRVDVPVFRGCDRPLRVAPAFADHIHGETGLGNAALPEPARPLQDAHAVDFIIDTLRRAPEASVTLAPTGPLTNIATALRRAPEIARGVRELVLMGGADAAGGNITPKAEFNFYADPHAAQTVMQSGLKLTVLGLDVTLQLRCTAARMARLHAADTPVTRAAAAMIGHVNAVYGAVYGAEGAALHDPCVIAYLLRPELFAVRPAHVALLTAPEAMRGHAGVSPPGPERPANAVWVDGVDAEAAFSLILERMTRL